MYELDIIIKLIKTIPFDGEKLHSACGLIYSSLRWIYKDTEIFLNKNHYPRSR